ncbi:type IV pilus twitching motility protein PilT [Delftia tsuruhatensis]|uniref:type IV pilus twitching motility protein PilT n=1 Tax=Delftia tsuruhatensis TaxID=180282 RepID=UPI00209000E9|nr:ATPase, T2SS/T4P/T4SS family [Delftia tsuruhatensis]MCO5338329.1 type IV pilus twitching motility protein PilT [Delftia tsuruhatensis]
MQQNSFVELDSFTDLINKIFNNNDSAMYTDVYIQPEQPVRLRITSNQWTDFEISCNGGTPRKLIYTAGDLNKLITNLFSKREQTPQSGGKWNDLLEKNNGCLHPMITLDAPGKTEGEVIPFRVRCTLQQQDMGGIGLMLRCLRPVAETLSELGLPETLSSICNARSGLVLVTGRTGAGKSTSIAAMLNQINKQRSSNIVIIEEPIEFIYRARMSRFTYREVGNDVDSYANAVEQALRYVPDVLSIGEIRDADTMKAAVRAGESGHLVFGTIHAANAMGAIRKALGFLDMQGEKLAFATNVVGVLAQALLPTTNSHAKSLAFEIMDFTAKQNGVTLLAETVEKMLSPQSDGTELQSFEKDFLSQQRRIGVGSSPFVQSLKYLLKHKKIDLSSALSLIHDSASIKELRDISNHS